MKQALRRAPNHWIDMWLALAVACAALLILSMLQPLLVVDQAVYRWVRFHSDSDVERAVEAIGTAIPFALAGLLLLISGRNRSHALSLAARLALVAVGAALLAEVLKTGIDRPRPSAFPGALGGNSLPSGHVMSTTAAAFAICLLAREVEPSRKIRSVVYFSAGAIVLAQVASRIVHGAHWMSDCAISVLLGLTWTLGLASALARSRMPITRAVVVNVALAAALLGLVSFSTLRLPFPSAHDLSAATMRRLSVDVSLPHSAMRAFRGR